MHQGLKVVLSYILLIAITVATGWFVYTNIYPYLFDDEDKREDIMARSMLISNTVSSLYQAEWLGTHFIQDDKDANFALYREALDSVGIMLDSLNAVTTNEHQRSIIQQIDSLLIFRDANIRDIAQRQQDMARRSRTEVKQKVDRVLPPLPAPSSAATKKAEVASTKPAVSVREQVIYDTIATAVNRPRKSFFERLGEAFSPPPANDSIMEIRQIRRTITDTLVSSPLLQPQPPRSQAADPSRNRDTVRQTVIRVLDDVEAQRQLQLQAISAQLTDLINTDRAINQQINKLLEDLNQEWLATTLTAIDNKHTSLEKAGRGVIYLGIGALVIILISTILLFSDLNKSRKYRRDLEVARNHAEDLMKSREKLLLTVTHDIKAPLSAIVGYLDLLRLPSPDKTTEQQLNQYLDPMVHSASHVMELIGNLLEYYRLDASKTQLNVCPTPLKLQFEEALAVFAPTARKKGVALTLTTEIPDALNVETDPLRLRQIIQNLLSNAVKFTDKGFIEVTAQLLPAEGANPGNNATLLCSVYDTGCGISPEWQQNVFEEFMRAEIPHSDREGVGLGLSIVKRLTALFQGQVELTTNSHGGSTFRVTMPIRVLGAEGAGSEAAGVGSAGSEAAGVGSAGSEAAGVGSAGSEAAEPLLPAAEPLRILVVDDDPAQLALAAEMLRRMGHLTALANSAERALQLLQKLRVDLILTDIQMPGHDGFYLLEQIRQQERLNPLAVVAVTANSIFSRKEFLEKGFNGMLPKPFVTRQLQHILTTTATSSTSTPTSTFPSPSITSSPSTFTTNPSSPSPSTTSPTSTSPSPSITSSTSTSPSTHFSAISPTSTSPSSTSPSAHRSPNSSPSAHPTLLHLGELGKMVDGDLEAVQQIMDVFYASSRENLQKMETAAEQQDFETIRHLAHKMLPMFRQLQSPLVAQLEQLERSTTYLPEITATLLKGLEEIVKEN